MVSEKVSEHLRICEEYCAHNYSPLKVVIERAEGVWVTDIEGKRYLDMHSAYSGLNFGHQNPRILKVAKAQLEKLTLTSRAFLHEHLGPFCKELAELSKMEMVLPMNSGAEAVETAVKLARRWGYEKKGIPSDKAEIITFTGNFHGRTTTIISFSDSEESKKNFGPFTPGFVVAPYGDEAALRKAVTSNTAGILIEPIQGEAGTIIPPEGFLCAVREICSTNNILMIADEIQSGFCRTGKIFACEHENVQPDVYIVGKSLGGGIFPLSAVMSPRKVMEVFTPGSHGSTFSGNPLACAVGREVIRIIKEEKPEERSAELGAYLLGRLQKMNLKMIKELRGKGLFIGMDVHKEFGKAKSFCEKLKDEGLLCKDTRDYSIRLAPPLIVTKDELDWSLDRIQKVFS